MPLPVENDPFGDDRGAIEKQARALLGDLQADNERYNRIVENNQTSTEITEKWPKDGLETTRQSSFIGRGIIKAAISYPLDRCNFLVVALRFRSYDPNLMDKVGEVNISRKERQTDFDIATYERGIFSSFTPNADQKIADQVSEEADQVILAYEDEQIKFYGRIPFRFNLGELGVLMLGEDPDKLRERYSIQYSYVPKPAEPLPVQVPRQSRSTRAFDPRLLTDHPAGQACLDTCLANGWLPGNGDILGLVKLWDQVKEGRRSEGEPTSKRLAFARWLVTHGRISEEMAS